MKLRFDFVSNSSSSSFVVWGAEVGAGLVVNQLKKEKGWDDEEVERIIQDGDIYDALYDINLNGAELHFDIPNIECCEDLDFYVMFGMYPTEMAEDETLGEFKERIKKELDKVFPGKSFDIEYIEYFSEG